MYEPHRSGNDASRLSFSLAYQVAEFHECRWSIAKGKERIGMLLDSQTNACLSPCNP